MTQSYLRKIELFLAVLVIGFVAYPAQADSLVIYSGTSGLHINSGHYPHEYYRDHHHYQHSHHYRYAPITLYSHSHHKTYIGSGRHDSYYGSHGYKNHHKHHDRHYDYGRYERHKRHDRRDGYRHDRRSRTHNYIGGSYD